MCAKNNRKISFDYKKLKEMHFVNKTIILNHQFESCFDVLSTLTVHLINISYE